MSTRPVPGAQRGMTMIELIIFIVVISLAIAGVLAMESRISASSVDPLERKQALLRAESLLEEVALARFTYCHPDDANAETAANAGACLSAPEGFGHPAAETRPYYNVNDYGSAAGVYTSFNNADPSGRSVTDATGALMQPAGYGALVKITPVSGFGPSGAGLPIGAVATPATTADAEVLLISVTITYGEPGSGGAGNARKSLTLERYRTRYAPNAIP